MLILAGLALTLVSGLIQGLFLVPLEEKRQWAWEHIWAVWSLVAMFGAPVVTVWLSIPDFTGWIAEAGLPNLGSACLVGLVAGTSGAALAYGVAHIGVAVAVGLNAGVSTIVGALVPLANGAAGNTTASVLILLVGLLLTLGGTCSSTMAAKARQRLEEGAKGMPSWKLWLAIGTTVYSGIASTAFNVGLAFPGELAAAARHSGAGSFGEAYAFLAPYMFGGFLFNFAFALWKVTRNGSWSLFRSARCAPEYGVAFAMGVAFAISIMLYSEAAAVLGSGWTQAGWAVLTSATILAAGVWDLRRKDWRGAARRHLLSALVRSTAAIPVLVLAESLRHR